MEQGNGHFVISWTGGGVPRRLECPVTQFMFYRRADSPLVFHRNGQRVQEDAASSEGGRRHDNEREARALAAHILGVPLPAEGPADSVAIYNDTWRWPALCVVGAAACAFRSPAVFPFALAATAFVETRVRSYMLYFVLLLVLVVEERGFSAALPGLMLAGTSSLGATTVTARVAALAYAALGVLGWYLRRPPQPLTLEWYYIVAAVVIAAAAGVAMWLSLEGLRLSMLIAPLLAAALLLDGRTFQASVLLAVCVAYVGWLSIDREVMHLREGRSRR